MKKGIDWNEGQPVLTLETVDLKIECLTLAVEAAKSREPKSVPVLDLAQTYYDWVTKKVKDGYEIEE